MLCLVARGDILGRGCTVWRFGGSPCTYAIRMVVLQLSVSFVQDSLASNSAGVLAGSMVAEEG